MGQLVGAPWLDMFHNTQVLTLWTAPLLCPCSQQQTCRQTVWLAMKHRRRPLTLAFTIVGRIWPNDPALIGFRRSREHGDPHVEQWRPSLWKAWVLWKASFPQDPQASHTTKTLLCSPSAAAAAKSLQSCLTLCNPWTAAHQAPLSLGFSRQEHWSGLPCPATASSSSPVGKSSPLLSYSHFPALFCLLGWRYSSWV